MPSHAGEDQRRGSLFVDDTVVAVITPPGQGGIAAIRLAGPESREIANRHFRAKEQSHKPLAPFHLRYGWFELNDGSHFDEVMIVFMPEGKSYTGVDQIEIYCHGGRQIVRRIMDELVLDGARPAEPGEFTKMAFLSGRVDLCRAEAVAEMIAADTEQSLKAGREHLMGEYSNHIDDLREQLVGMISQLEASIDFSEEEITTEKKEALDSRLESILREIDLLLSSYQGGRIIREGFRVAIAGRPNAGKSSLFNLLLSQERALVSPLAGTTRDYLREWIDLGGFAVSLTDTAGLRQGGGEIEQSGQQLTQTQLGESDMILWLYDLSDKEWKMRLAEVRPSLPEPKVLFVGNKADIACSAGQNSDYMLISCRTGEGIGELKDIIRERIERESGDLTSGLVVTSARHQRNLSSARNAVGSARSLLASGDAPELQVFELKRAADALAEITGRIYNEDILTEIFSSFCIGK